VFVLSFYNKYIRLCTEKGISPSAAAIEIGIRKSNVTYWKSNRNNPSDATLQKIADYFGVTVEYLKGEETKKDPGQKTEAEIDGELLEIWNTGDEDEHRALLEMARLIKSRRNKK
jgi:transcriptional regulator with XRE-family HTH domain